jgi:signal transduction histidine kinase
LKLLRGLLCWICDRLPDADVLATARRKLIEAHEEERAWLARELHDDIAQRLALIQMSLRHAHEADPSLANLKDGIGNAVHQLSELNEDIHRLSHRLHSSHLEVLGLAAAATDYCREVAEQHNVQIELRARDMPLDVSPEIALSIFRVLQEALQNAIKHSGSRRFDVALDHDATAIHLTVRDSGKGFDAAAAIKGRGLGLTSIKERVALVDGELSIDSQPQRGTTIDVRVPLRSGVGSAQLTG